jgi:beta-galactosidase/beta-glucuronidase
MLPPYVIRLRGPWQYEPPPPAPPGRVTLPMSWADVPRRDGPGGACFRRHFNRPTGLEPNQRVWIVVERIGAGSTVSLNDRPLGAVGDGGTAAEFDITGLLEDSNHLALTVDFPQPGASGPFGDVRLEIRG